METIINNVTFDKSETTLIQCAQSVSGDYTVPNTTMFINEEAFKNCKLLSSIRLPDSILSIGYGAFYGCSGLVSINIPSKTHYIHQSLLKGCTSLKEIYSQCVAPPICLEKSNSMFLDDDKLGIANLPTHKRLEPKLNCFEGINKEICVLYVPIGSLAAYKSAKGWCEFKNIVENN